LKLFEHEAKDIFHSYRIPVPIGGVATSVKDAVRIAAGLRSPFALKAQVLVAGRGRAGGILFADTAEQVEKSASKLLNMSIGGAQVKKVLVEERVSIAKELYFGVTVDRIERKYDAIASNSGGMDIEQTATENPEAITKLLIDPQTGFTMTDSRQLAMQMGYLGKQQAGLAKILSNLYCAAVDFDAELIEMNPLAETFEGKFVALDARLIVDDNALFRHPDLEKKIHIEPREKTPEELEAEEAGLAYVKLDGNIAVVGNGAGLVMATLDTIQYYKGRAADFLDLGGGAPIERIKKALDIVLRNAKVKVVLVNILGGITHCDDVARAISQTRNSSSPTKPFLVRLLGTNEKKGKRILDEAGINVLDSMEEAAKCAVDIARRLDNGHHRR
jgi:succinyl-CoA synthetase beta subunit